MILKNVKIVLCKVSEAGNVGAICRVMKNMGLSELRLAAPELSLGETSPNIQEISSRAVHALDIWENAQIFDTLADSVKDCSIVIGTTRRRGQYRKNISMTPRALAVWLAEHPGLAPETASIAIVFGNERTGLEDSELDLCNFASHIPVSDAQPSLNLSHAVQVYAYELFLACGDRARPIKGDWIPMPQEKITALVATITNNLEKVGFYKQYGREEQERFLQDVVARAGLSEKEGSYFKDLLIKAGRLG